MQVRIRELPDGTVLVRVHGCPECHRWTRVNTPISPRRYPYHRPGCEWGWEELPERAAHIDPARITADFTPHILSLLPEGANPLTWEPT